MGDIMQGKKDGEGAPNQNNIIENEMKVHRKKGKKYEGNA